MQDELERNQTVKLTSFAPALLVVLMGCGSSSDMKLYPLEGPIAEAEPTLVINVALKYINDTSGEISFRLPGKVKCAGSWTTVAPREITQKRGLSIGLKGPGGNLGRDETTVGGVNNGEIYAVCKDGRKVQGSFLIGSGTQSGTGRATDTAGNTYKLLF